MSRFSSNLLTLQPRTDFQAGAGWRWARYQAALACALARLVREGRYLVGGPTISLSPAAKSLTLDAKGFLWSTSSSDNLAKPRSTLQHRVAHVRPSFLHEGVEVTAPLLDLAVDAAKLLPQIPSPQHQSIHVAPNFIWLVPPAVGRFFLTISHRNFPLAWPQCWPVLHGPIKAVDRTISFSPAAKSLTLEAPPKRGLSRFIAALLDRQTCSHTCNGWWRVQTPTRRHRLSWRPERNPDSWSACGLQRWHSRWLPQKKR